MYDMAARAKNLNREQIAFIANELVTTEEELAEADDVTWFCICNEMENMEVFETDDAGNISEKGKKAAGIVTVLGAALMR